jgi:hypothetical protein
MRGKCFKCEHRGTIPGDAHSCCKNKKAKVQGDEYGRKMGWFVWPWNFDPAWLISCDGFKTKE